MTVADLRSRAPASLLPPPRQPLSAWIEANVVLPQGTTAVPGPMRLWPYQRAIADSIADPGIEQGGARQGGANRLHEFADRRARALRGNEPAPVLVLLPTESDVLRAAA